MSSPAPTSTTSTQVPAWPQFMLPAESVPCRAPPARRSSASWSRRASTSAFATSKAARLACTTSFGQPYKSKADTDTAAEASVLEEDTAKRSDSGAPASAREALYDLVAFFIEQGFDPNVADFDGNTPAHFAARSGDLGLVKLLVTEGQVDMTAMNNKRKSPAGVAATREIRQYILGATGVDIDDGNADDSGSLDASAAARTSANYSDAKLSPQPPQAAIARLSIPDASSELSPQRSARIDEETRRQLEQRIRALEAENDSLRNDLTRSQRRARQAESDINRAYEFARKEIRSIFQCANLITSGVTFESPGDTAEASARPTGTSILDLVQRTFEAAVPNFGSEPSYRDLSAIQQTRISVHLQDTLTADEIRIHASTGIAIIERALYSIREVLRIVSRTIRPPHPAGASESQPSSRSTTRPAPTPAPSHPPPPAASELYTLFLALPEVSDKLRKMKILKSETAVMKRGNAPAEDIEAKREQYTNLVVSLLLAFKQKTGYDTDLETLQRALKRREQSLAESGAGRSAAPHAGHSDPAHQRPFRALSPDTDPEHPAASDPGRAAGTRTMSPPWSLAGSDMEHLGGQKPEQRPH
ncbi:uncharacterized protein BJ171DRAFT_90593 [Polychytrium aggregatum]|uniref:uncharacterized protein n=1 Tax=Polychytrium aggregatum TaxID=110093 RepID=UPI0022FF3117|nr:uncharacterized protein BJ171DRAFT_90593 [Polychytrium aggregatum]KAI9204846.1 hypothetical protein BJ171DRAFT_90593 [Polychytrium aggregatum]